MQNVRKMATKADPRAVAGRRKKISPAAVALIITVAVIWGQSMIPGELSSEESGTVLQILLPVWESTGLGQVIPLNDQIVRKAFGHFLEYSVLGMELRAMINLRKRDTSIFYPFIGAAVAIVDEMIQMITPNRGPSFGDVLLDCCGVILGTAISLAVRFVFALCKAPAKSRL